MHVASYTSFLFYYLQECTLKMYVQVYKYEPFVLRMHEKIPHSLLTKSPQHI